MKKLYIIIFLAVAIICGMLITFTTNPPQPQEVHTRDALLESYREYYRVADSLIWDIQDVDLNPLFGKYLEARENVAFQEYRHSGKW